MKQLYVIDARGLWDRVHSYVEMMSEYNFNRIFLIEVICDVINQLNAGTTVLTKWDLMHEVLWSRLILTCNVDQIDAHTLDNIDGMLYEAGEVVLSFIEQTMFPVLEITKTNEVMLNYYGQNGDDVAIEMTITGINYG